MRKSVIIALGSVIAVCGAVVCYYKKQKDLKTDKEDKFEKKCEEPSATEPSISEESIIEETTETVEEIVAETNTVEEELHTYNVSVVSISKDAEFILNMLKSTDSSWLSVRYDERKYKYFRKKILLFCRGEYYKYIGTISDNDFNLVSDILDDAKIYELSIDETLLEKERKLILSIKTNYTPPKEDDLKTAHQLAKKWFGDKFSHPRINASLRTMPLEIKENHIFKLPSKKDGNIIYHYDKVAVQWLYEHFVEKGDIKEQRGV